MSYQNSRYTFEAAKPCDGVEMLEILEDEDFKGQISLVYTRRPNAFTSINAEGIGAEIVLCRDSEKNKIVGFGACNIQKLYINGKETKVGYLLGMRVRKDYRRLFPVIPKGYSMLDEFCKENEVRYCFTSILEENIYAQKLLEKKRKFMPEYIPLSRYETFIIKTGTGAKVSKGYKLCEAKNENIPDIVKLMNETGQKSQLFPVIEESDFNKESFLGLKLEDFHILIDQGGKVVACGAVWNQNAYKQYILGGYGGVLKALYPISPVFKLFGYPRLPKPGKVLEFFTLAFLSVKDNDESIFNTFITMVSNAQKKYPFFVIGMGEQNKLIKAVKAIHHISYKSRIYLVDWYKTGQLKDDLNDQFPVNPECSLI